MAKNGAIEIFNEQTQSYENMHPESNWEQIKVNKTQSMKDILNQDSLIGTINHNLNRIPIVQLLKYEYGAGIGGAGETAAGGTNPILDNMITIEHTSLNSFDVKVTSEYLDMGEITIEKNLHRDEYYFSFENSPQNICVILY